MSSRILQIFRTPRNAFGLYRQYYTDRLPSHDPEENIQLKDLVEESNNGQASPVALSLEHQSDNLLYPFPNKNSFLLSEWYWNDGVQKTRESFNKLIRIVGDPSFRPVDVQHKQWSKINTILASDDFHETDSADNKEDAGWMDEDAGWKRSPITISVPFHSRAKTPGPKDYLVGHLFHRSLVSVIREKLTNQEHMQHFHYEPFEVFWKPDDASPDVRVHGELYTSPAFIDAHRELQQSPGEPGCDLPRVLIAMMFWSDATHLTSFGTAKLWPCYLYFGNESKYRRCKPTCNLCNHVAYFQSVRCHFISHNFV
jgi:hypothetical protein